MAGKILDGCGGILESWWRKERVVNQDLKKQNWGVEQAEHTGFGKILFVTLINSHLEEGKDKNQKPG